jgi:hypothetical protein
LHIAIGQRMRAQARWMGQRVAVWDSSATTPATDLPALLDSITALLDAMPSPRHKLLAPKSAQLVVPDNLARLQLLPWTPALATPDELQQFAIERFDMADMSVRDGWTVHARWQQYQAPTLAYALPNTLVEAAHGLLAQSGLRLTSILPASANVHYRRVGLIRKPETYLIHSGASISMLRYEKTGLAEFLSETCRNSHSLKRLLARVATSTDAPADTRWALSDIDPVALTPLIGDASPASVRTLNLCETRFA